MPIVQPSGKVLAAGINFGSPSGVPCSTQASSVARWRLLRPRSLLKWPYRGSACHGGIRPSSTTSRIDRPSPSLIVGQKRERANLARAVARLALRLQDRRDVHRVRHRVYPDRLIAALERSAYLASGGPNPRTVADPAIALARSIGQPTTGVLARATSRAASTASSASTR